MTGGARAAALLVAVLAAAFGVAAVAVFHVTVTVLRRRDACRARALAARHAAVGRHEADRAEPVVWAVSLVARWFRHEDGGPKTAVALASLFLAFAVLIGASQ